MSLPSPPLIRSLPSSPSSVSFPPPPETTSLPSPPDRSASIVSASDTPNVSSADPPSATIVPIGSFLPKRSNTPNAKTATSPGAAGISSVLGTSPTINISDCARPVRLPSSSNSASAASSIVLRLARDPTLSVSNPASLSVASPAFSTSSSSITSVGGGLQGSMLNCASVTSASERVLVKEKKPKPILKTRLIPAVILPAMSLKKQPPSSDRRALLSPSPVPPRKTSIWPMMPPSTATRAITTSTPPPANKPSEEFAIGCLVSASTPSPTVVSGRSGEMKNPSRKSKFPSNPAVS